MELAEEGEYESRRLVHRKAVAEMLEEVQSLDTAWGRAVRVGVGVCRWQSACVLCWRLPAQVLSALDAAIDSLQTTCGTTGDASGSGNPSGGHWHGCRLLVLHFRYDSVVRLRVRLTMKRNLQTTHD